MRRTGSADLPLHSGRAPEWLYKKMRILGGEIAYLIVEDKGGVGLLERLSNPIWLQGLGCLLGFDWHSSGLTTVTLSALKEGLDSYDLGVRMVGGKGGFGDLPQEIEDRSEEMGISSGRISELKMASRMTAKIDGTAIQDGFSLYHHVMAITEDGQWTVVQQGMHSEKRIARRYHWYSGAYNSFTNDPEQGVIGETAGIRVLNTVNRDALNNQKAMVDLTSDRTFLNSMKADSVGSYSLDRWTDATKGDIVHVSYPLHVSWKLLNKLYEVKLRRYEDLLLFHGMGPMAVRALALAAEIVYGTPATWKDTIKYSYAHGGKDGVPFPVDRKVYDSTIDELRQVVDTTNMAYEEKKRAIKRLGRLWG